MSKRKYNYSGYDKCYSCKGEGEIKYGKHYLCKKCDGKGTIDIPNKPHDMYGCNGCGGNGRFQSEFYKEGTGMACDSSICTICEGTGMSLTNSELQKQLDKLEKLVNKLVKLTDTHEKQLKKLKTK